MPLPISADCAIPPGALIEVLAHTGEDVELASGLTYVYEFNQIKREQYPWMMESGKIAGCHGRLRMWDWGCSGR